MGEIKTQSKGSEKDSLGQPVNTTGGRTLGMGCAAPGGGHGGRPPQGRRAGAEAVTARVYDRLAIDTMLERREGFGGIIRCIA